MQLSMRFWHFVCSLLIHEQYWYKLLVNYLFLPVIDARIVNRTKKINIMFPPQRPHSLPPQRGLTTPSALRRQQPSIEGYKLVNTYLCLYDY